MPMARGNFECPICKDVDTRYLLCLVGHTLCGDCFTNLPTKTCPTCRGDFHDPPTRNIMVETMVQDKANGLIKPCVNQDKNCPFVGTRKQIDDHHCEFIDILCPVHLCDATVQLHSVDKHIEDVHLGKEIKSHELNSVDTYLDMPNFKADLLSHPVWTALKIKYDGQIFYPFCQINLETNEFCTWVYTKSRQRYKVETTATGPDSSTSTGPESQVKFTGDTFCFDVARETVFKSAECLSLSVKQLEKLLKPSTEATPDSYIHFLSMSSKLLIKK